MLFALDIEGNKVYIDSAKRSEDYFCPCCGSKMVLRMGDIRQHHFAHPNESICKDSWHYDMTEWHYDWQNKFPKEYQEVVKEYDGEKNILVISLSDIPADAHTEVCLVHTNEAQNNEREYAIDIMDYAYMEYDLKTEITTALDTAENKVMRLGIINTLVKDISLREALVEIYTAQTDDCMV